MQREIETVTEKLRICSNELDLNCHVEFKNDILTLEFKKEPQPEFVKKIEEMVFFTNEVSMSNASSKFTCSGNGTVIKINLKDYPIFYQLYETLKSFKCNIFMVKILENEVVFAYTLKHKHNLNSDELDALQNIINPEIKEHDSIRVSYLKGISRLSASLVKKQNTAGTV